MREILELCVELDSIAYKTYRQLSEHCPDPGLATLFSQMAIEERQHLDWWRDLLIAWEGGLVPDIAYEADLLERLQAIAADATATAAVDCSTLTGDQMLDTAAHLEFYLLDPVFGELVDLMQPGNRVEVREAYSRHVLRLVEAIEQRYSEQGLATFLARVLRRAYRDQQRLASLAMRDQLTGLYNRRGLLSHASQWLSWSARYGRPVGIVLVDIDNFKRINDTHGHAAGDRALEAIASAMTSATRTSDVVGRFGGDEFMVLAPETDGPELTRLMERIAQTVRAASLCIDGVDLNLSVSAGGAWAPGGVEISCEALTSAADRSLYQAKEAGRDRAGEPMLTGPA